MSNPTQIPDDSPEDSPQHISTVVLDEIIRAATVSFTYEQLFYLSEEFEIIALRKFQEELIADDSWMEGEL